MIAYADRVYNPFPDIAGILLDDSGTKVLNTHFTPKSEMIADINENKEGLADFNIENFVKKFSDYTSNNSIYIKTLITEQNEILLLYPHPYKTTENEVSVTKFGGEAGT